MTNCWCDPDIPRQEWPSKCSRGEARSIFKEEHIPLFGGLSPIDPAHWRKIKGLQWGVRGVFLPAAVMVMVVIGLGLLDARCRRQHKLREELDRFTYVTYIGLNYLGGLKSNRWHVWTCPPNLRLFSS